MCTTSRKPFVVSIPASAPRCSSTAFVATVVPWKTRVDLRRLDPRLAAELDEPRDHRPARVVGRRAHLVHVHRPRLRVVEHEVGEGAADVDTDNPHPTAILFGCICAGPSSAVASRGQPMLDGIFIYDNAIHCYDMSDENLREDRADAEYSRDLLLAMGAGGRWAALQRRLDRVQAPVDDRGAVRDGLRRRADRPGDGAGRARVRLVQGHLRARPDAARDGEALSGARRVLRRRRPALPGRRRPRSSSSTGR